MFNNETSQPPSSGFISVVFLTSEKARVAATFFSIKVTNYSLAGSCSLQTIDLVSPLPYIKKKKKLNPLQRCQIYKYHFLALGSFLLLTTYITMDSSEKVGDSGSS